MGGAYIPQEGLAALEKYKYVSGEYSWLDLRLNGFWYWCADQLPMWMAPNLVTLIGTFHLGMIAGMALVFDPALEGKAPTWVYVANAWCLFVYQTMDAVDGKQARRTGSSSPLGQLFDHGCDGLGTTLIALGLLSLMSFGTSSSGLMVLATVQVPFYVCQWEENYLHVLRAQVGNFGVTEGQYLSIALNLVTALFGTGMWRQTVSETIARLLGSGAAEAAAGVLPELIVGSQIRHISVVIGGFFPALLALSALYNVYTHKDAKIIRSTILLSPLILQQALQYSVKEFAPVNYRAHLVSYILFFGMLNSHLSNRIIVASVCHLEVPLFHRILYPAPLVIMLVFAMKQFEESGGSAALRFSVIEYALGVYCLLIGAQYVHFVYSVTMSITGKLGIRCFSIVKKDKTK